MLGVIIGEWNIPIFEVLLVALASYALLAVLSLVFTAARLLIAVKRYRADPEGDGHELIHDVCKKIMERK